MASTIEEWFAVENNIELYAKTWKSALEPPAATVVFIHGFSEHVDRYDHVFKKFQEANIEVFGFDQRGFGKTALKYKNPGVCGGWKVQLGDITAALKAKRREGIPQFLFGHSMGGALCISYATEGPDRDNVAGFLVSSPLLSQSPKTKTAYPIIFMGGLVAKILPSFQIPAKVPSTYISRIPEEVEKYESNSLIHGVGSLRGLSDMLTLPKSVLKESYQSLTKPILLAHGTSDHITCHNTTREFFEKIPAKDKTLREWEGGYHELHNDLDQDAVIDDYIKWILERINNGKTAAE